MPHCPSPQSQCHSVTVEHVAVAIIVVVLSLSSIVRSFVRLFIRCHRWFVPFVVDRRRRRRRLGGWLFCNRPFSL